MANPNEYRGLPLESVLGTAEVPATGVLLSAEQLRQTDLSTARDVELLIVRDFPFAGCLVSLEPSGLHWKISVMHQGYNSPEMHQIWNSVLRIASQQAGAQLINDQKGLWILRLWLPLVRGGAQAMQFISEAVRPILTRIPAVLQEITEQAPQ